MARLTCIPKVVLDCALSPGGSKRGRLSLFPETLRLRPRLIRSSLLGSLISINQVGAALVMFPRCATLDAPRRWRRFSADLVVAKVRGFAQSVPESRSTLEHRQQKRERAGRASRYLTLYPHYSSSTDHPLMRTTRHLSMPTPRVSRALFQIITLSHKHESLQCPPFSVKALITIEQKIILDPYNWSFFVHVFEKRLRLSSSIYLILRYSSLALFYKIMRPATFAGVAVHSKRIIFTFQCMHIFSFHFFFVFNSRRF